MRLRKFLMVGLLICLTAGHASDCGDELEGMSPEVRAKITDALRTELSKTKLFQELEVGVQFKLGDFHSEGIVPAHVRFALRFHQIVEELAISRITIVDKGDMVFRSPTKSIVIRGTKAALLGVIAPRPDVLWMGLPSEITFP